MKIFIDSNIYLDVYRNPNNKGLFNSIKNLSETGNLIVTQQVVYEVLRNCYKVSYDLYKEQTIIPQKAFIGFSTDKNIFEFEEISNNEMVNNIISNFKESRNLVLKGLSCHLEKVAKNEDKMSIFLKSIFKNKIAPTTEQFFKAKKRFDLGNPPRKKEYSIGDAINWVQILDIAKEEKTVLIVSRDSDFTIKLFDQKIELNPYLKDECENLNINIIPFDDIDKAKHFYYNENNNIFEDNDNKIEDEDIAQVRNIIKCDHSNWHEEIQGRFCVNVCDKCGLGLYARLLSEDDLW